MRNKITHHPFVQLLHYMRPFRRDYLAASLYSFLNKFFDIMPEVFLGIAINTVVEREDSWLSGLGFSDLRVQLLLLGLMSLMGYGLESLFEYLSSVKWWRLAQNVQHNFRMEVFDHVQRSTMTASFKQKTGNLIAILNEDANQLERFLEEGIDEIMELISSVILIGSIFFFISPTIALFAMLPTPLITYGTFVFQGKLSPLYLTIREKAGALTTRLANSFLGIFTTKSLVAEQIEIKKLEKASQAYKEANFQAIRWSALFVPTIRFAIVLGYLVTLIYGGMLTMGDKLDVGAYSTLLFLTHRLLWPFVDLSENVINFQRVMAATKRLLQIFKMPLEVSPSRSIHLKGGITFSSVSFFYEKYTPTLRHLSFDILPGQTVAFVGSTGAGKSTLLKLLLGLYFPTEGQIFFDSQDLKTLSLPALRRQIGFVGQDPFIFEGTIAENISYAFSGATQAQIIQAAQNAAAHEFIVRLPKGYETWIGERGQVLSGGQKQRLAIARALVRDPVILILDEATSAVDNATELAIQQSLAKTSNGRTTILIAHRLSTVRKADRIFVLKHGKIIEQGTHQDLLQQDQLYANLWKLQTGEHLTNVEILAEKDNFVHSRARTLQNA